VGLECLTVSPIYFSTKTEQVNIKCLRVLMLSVNITHTRAVHSFSVL